jgi:hypothetical protein
VRGVPILEIAPVSATPAEQPASAFVHSLVAAMVGGVASVANDKVAVEYAATFVDGQLKALQPKLRFMFESGMTFFRFVTRLRYLRGYCDLPLPKRRAWTMKWAENRIALLRQLFKPVRATALLAYYDHDAVKSVLLADQLPAASLVRERVAPEAAVVETPS